MKRLSKETKKLILGVTFIIGLCLIFMKAVSMHYQPRTTVDKVDFQQYLRFTSQLVLPNDTLSSLYDDMCQKHPLTETLYTRGEWINSVLNINPDMNANYIVAGNYIVLPYYTAIDAEPSDE